MEEGLDAGDILETKVFYIPSDMRLEALMRQLTIDAAKLTLSTIRNFSSITPKKQDESLATLCKKIKKLDGEIDFEDAMTIYNKYRAFEGWPGIFVNNGSKCGGVYLMDAKKENTPYEILAFENEAVIVGCTQGALKIETIQPVSKKAMSSKAYCVGRGLKVADKLF